MIVCSAGSAATHCVPHTRSRWTSTRPLCRWTLQCCSAALYAWTTVPDFRWSAISWRSRWISLMLSLWDEPTATAPPRSFRFSHEVVPSPERFRVRLTASAVGSFWTRPVLIAHQLSASGSTDDRRRKRGTPSSLVWGAASGFAAWQPLGVASRPGQGWPSRCRLGWRWGCQATP